MIRAEQYDRDEFHRMNGLMQVHVYMYSLTHPDSPIRHRCVCDCLTSHPNSTVFSMKKADLLLVRRRHEIIVQYYDRAHRRWLPLPDILPLYPTAKPGQVYILLRYQLKLNQKQRIELIKPRFVKAERVKTWGEAVRRVKLVEECARKSNGKLSEREAAMELGWSHQEHRDQSNAINWATHYGLDPYNEAYANEPYGARYGRFKNCVGRRTYRGSKKHKRQPVPN
jgi:hypothetical protein